MSAPIKYVAPRALWFLSLFIALDVAAAIRSDAGEPPYVGDPVEVTAARQREIVVRMVLAGLERAKSQRKEDAGLVVCEKSKRTGTHLTSIRCATNAGWLKLGAESMRANADLWKMSGGESSILAPLLVRAAAQTPYTTHTAAEVMEFDLGILAARGEFEGSAAEHEARMRELLAHEAAERTIDGFRTPPAAVVDFAQAFLEVGRLGAVAGAACEREPACAARLDAALEAAIRGAGLEPDAYNLYVARLEGDEAFRTRVHYVIDELKRAR